TADAALDANANLFVTFAAMCVVSAVVFERRRADVGEEAAFGLHFDIGLAWDFQTDLTNSNFDLCIDRVAEVAAEIDFGATDAAFKFEALNLRVTEAMHDEFADTALDIERVHDLARRFIERHLCFAHAAAQSHPADLQAAHFEVRLGHTCSQIEIERN